MEARGFEIFSVYLQFITCLQFAEANVAVVATAREGYVLASMMEEKTAELQRQLDEAAKSLERASSTSDEWEHKSRDAGAKLAEESAAVAEAKDRYTALEAVVRDSFQRTLGKFASSELSPQVI
jgi:hypothetical protein